MDDLFDYFIQCIKYLKLKFYIADALELVLFALKKSTIQCIMRLTETFSFCLEAISQHLSNHLVG